SSEWPTATATTSTSSSKSAKPSPEMGHEPFFSPGMIYGSTRATDITETLLFTHTAPQGVTYASADHLNIRAIGGRETYTSGDCQVWIREDRLPAPLFGMYFDDGTSVTVLDPSPRVVTTFEDSHDMEAVPLIDERFGFGSVGASTHGTRQLCGFWMPGTEGEVTYRGDTYPIGQLRKWRRRYHPVKDGLTQRYEVEFRFGSDASFPDYRNHAWRWGWGTLQPQVTLHDIEQVRDSVTKMLGERVEHTEGRAGIPNSMLCAGQERDFSTVNFEVIMGFTGKNLEAAYYFLKDSYRKDNAYGHAHGRLGTEIIDSFVKSLKVDPPAGEGFQIATGEPALALRRGNVVHLRSFGDGMKAAMRAYLLEEENGVRHEGWLVWVRGFGDWLLTQQTPEGAFPRTWRPGTGEIADSSPQTTYNAIPFLVMLSQATDSERYLDAAVAAGEFCWANGQEDGVFVGGTIDNPNIIDKEAGTLSLEAYLILYETTNESKWLERARMAADFSETWIYLYNIPMPEDDDDRTLHWKKGVPTTGMQLIATGHSLVDHYMSYDADEYAHLYWYTKDAHYYEVARLLLHNTKNMMALDGRLYDLHGPGWQQEHWSFAPPRGYGLHRNWLPWDATSQLNGIWGMEDLDPDLLEALTK
ncbi:MAG: hypothetical protein JW741_07080, partial [Sedimentisphaerales bacterium]|nr:hypothetical protein [Sedimentisphaerales bacterium]